MYSRYLRAAPGLMGNAQGISPSPQSFRRTARMSEGKFVKLFHLLRSRLDKNELYKKLNTYLVHDLRAQGTAVNVFCIL